MEYGKVIKMACKCDYSYTCEECQLRIDAANQAEYIDELREWAIVAIAALAKKMGLEIPEPPKKRFHY